MLINCDSVAFVDLNNICKTVSFYDENGDTLFDVSFANGTDKLFDDFSQNVSKKYRVSEIVG